MRMRTRPSLIAAVFFLLIALFSAAALAQNAGVQEKDLGLPTSKLLHVPAPGDPERTNSLPLALAVSPDGKWIAALNNGFGAKESQGRQSIGIVELATHKVADFTDARLGPRAAQSYFVGLAWSGDGAHLYASIGSITDPEGAKAGNLGNGIAVYGFRAGRLTPERFIKIPLQKLAEGRKSAKVLKQLADDQAVPYPAGLAVIGAGHDEKLLVADNLSDNALLIEAASGKIVRRFDLSISRQVPASYPYHVAALADGSRAWVSLWNAARVAELDLRCTAGCAPVKMIALRQPKLATDPGSHPTALLLDESAGALYVTLANTDEIAVIDIDGQRPPRFVSTRLPGQRFGGAYPNALALAPDGRLLMVANASSDAVGVYRVKARRGAKAGARRFDALQPLGWIPTEWYPTALAVTSGELFIASGKGQSTGPNNQPSSPGADVRRRFTYVASLLHGSLAHLRLDAIDSRDKLRSLTDEVLRLNLMRGTTAKFTFAGGRNPIKHVIYVIKENRTYDQLFGDLKPGDGDPSLTLYGEEITPNHHRLARQFGVIDNFFDSGEVSGDGHVWSNAAITSDYTEKTWQIGYRSRERTYDYEGTNANAVPLDHDIADVNEPGTGYLWTNLARHRRSYRHYGEYVTSKWCNEEGTQNAPPQAGTPLAVGQRCAQTAIAPGAALPDGTPSPYGWPVPVLARNEATKPELRGHFAPLFADFRLDYPDQMRADEFLREFGEYVRNGKLPEFITLRLPNDHTAGTRLGMPTPDASVADNDLALGRVVEAVSHSPYWDSTAIFVLEDDAQSGPDHVDAHRSIALVISKYAPLPDNGVPFLDHNFYTTVNTIHTMEALLGLPPMNNNDARAAVMAPLFAGSGAQPAFQADYRNRDNGMIYRANKAGARGAAESAQMDFSHADAADSTKLNQVLWQARKGDTPMPAPVHRVIPE